MTIETADPPRLVAVRVRERRASLRFAIGTVPRHPTIPVTETGYGSGFGFRGRCGGGNKEAIHFGNTSSGYFDEESVGFQRGCFGHDNFWDVWISGFIGLIIPTHKTIW